MGLLAPNPRHLLKKVDENFQTWVQCEHWRLNGRTHCVQKQKSPSCNFFEDRGVGEESFLFKESFFPHIIIYKLSIILRYRKE